MDLIVQFFHKLYHFNDLILWGGYSALTFIVFAETGLMFGFFFPGDSLLVSAGLLASQGDLSIGLLCLELCTAAILGNALGYAFGRKVGVSLFTREDSLLFRKSNVLKAHAFYEKYGSKTMIISRFVPVVRTFAPIVAGIGKMDFRQFMLYNVVGGVGWVLLTLLTGYYLGRLVPHVDRYVHKIILVVIFLSVLPIFYEWWHERRKKVV